MAAAAAAAATPTTAIDQKAPSIKLISAEELLAINAQKVKEDAELKVMFAKCFNAVAADYMSQLCVRLSERATEGRTNMTVQFSEPGAETCAYFTVSTTHRTADTGITETYVPHVWYIPIVTARIRADLTATNNASGEFHFDDFGGSVFRIGWGTPACRSVPKYTPAQIEAFQRDHY